MGRDWNILTVSYRKLLVSLHDINVSTKRFKSPLFFTTPRSSISGEATSRDRLAAMLARNYAPKNGRIQKVMGQLKCKPWSESVYDSIGT